MPAPRLKIALIGAGSTVFTRNLIGDILSYPALSDCEVSLHDIDPQRLRLSEQVASRIARMLDVKPVISASLDRRTALDGARFVINTIQVGGYKPATVLDFELPKRFGLEQTIGDTLGIGGIMRALRTIPVQLEMLADIEQVCEPDAVHLNYVNPMAMNTWALNAGNRRVPTIGLCHSVQHTARELAVDLGLAGERIDYYCAGINHMAFFLRFEHRGENLYPKLHALAQAGTVPAWNRVRYAMMRRFGYFPTESSEHLAEYTPWFIKPGRQDLLEQYNIPLDEYLGRCQINEIAWPYIERELLTPDPMNRTAMSEALTAAQIRVMPRSLDDAANLIEGLRRFERSVEYGATIIDAIVTGRPAVIHGNLTNHKLIGNLPADCTVEVPCLVDHNGVQPLRVGALPLQLSSLMQTNINVQALVVAAALQQRRDHVYHAALLDPHTSATLDIDQIHTLVDALLDAHRDYLPEYLH